MAARSSLPDQGLIERIYDAALNDDLFPDLIDEIRRYFQSDGGFYLLHDPSAVTGSMAVVAGFSPEIMQRYQELAPFNLRIQAGASHMRVGSVAAGTDFVADRDFKKTVFYDEFVRPLGVLPDLGTLVEQTESTSAVLLVIRDPRRGEYDAAERRALKILSGHLNRAVGVRRRLQSAEQSLALERLALDQFGVAFLLLNRQGHLVFANRCAESLLNRQQALRLRAGAIEPVDARERALFNQFVRDAIDATDRVEALPASNHLTLRSGDEHPSHVATFCPVRLPALALGGPTAVVAVFIQQTGIDRAARVDTAVLQRLFGLSLTEARLAVMLVRGLTVAEASRELGQKTNTTRTVLKSIFAKTGTHRQVELVALLLGCGTG